MLEGRYRFFGAMGEVVAWRVGVCCLLRLSIQSKLCISHQVEHLKIIVLIERKIRNTLLQF